LRDAGEFIVFPATSRLGAFWTPTSWAREASLVASVQQPTQQATSRLRRVVAQQSHPNEIDGLMLCLIRGADDNY